MNQVQQNIEALIFCSEQSISIDEIAASLKISFGWELADEEIVSAIDQIKAKYTSEEFAFELVEIAEGYQFLTKKEFHPAVSALIQHKAKKKLSTSAMETLAIIAYKQPITKSEIEHIRGVNCDYAVQKLLEKELIEINGKSDAPGKPLMYVTSQSFMDYFGIRTVKDLPQLKDLHPEQNEIGEQIEYVEETVSETIEEITVIPEPVAENSTEEIVAIEDAVSPSDLPDRKTIFMEHEEKKSSLTDETAAHDIDDSYEAPRD
jgi:segregation and condensation protein B